MADATGAPPRRGLGLEIATWVVVALNLLTLTVLGPAGAGLMGLQASISIDHGEPVDAGALTVGYWLGIAVATVVCNGLAIWQRRSWGLGWALLAAAACWAVFLITVAMAGG